MVKVAQADALVNPGAAALPMILVFVLPAIHTTFKVRTIYDSYNLRGLGKSEPKYRPG